MTARVRSATCALAVAAGATLSACGGGGSGGESTTASADPLFGTAQAERIRAITNSGVPEETGEQIVQRREAQDRSGWVGGHFTYREDMTQVTSDALVELYRDMGEPGASLVWPTLLTRNGVTLFGTEADDARFLGATLDHGAFGVFTTNAFDGGIVAELIGSPSGAAPEASATWRGVMVGAEKEDLDLLQGDAVISFDLAASAIDVNFTNIVNLDTVAVHSVPTVTFSDVPVSADGTWNMGDNGEPRRLLGSFGGPGHEEAGGQFWTPDMTGAFGARR
ncbi:MAG: hypothetical protein F4X97_14055 [Boseongicola sp. SB0662_bin_57]|nr:hypothetical protein [Boseongicola sp. SB0662_bin_57]